MKMLIASALGLVLLGGCTAEKNAVPAGESATATAAQDTSATTAAIDTAVEASTGENHESGTWAGQIRVAEPVSMFNYVGAESGDFAPMRFRNDSEAGRKILAACSDGDNCELTGAVEWLDEPPPPDASAVGRIVRVDSVKRLPAR